MKKNILMLGLLVLGAAVRVSASEQERISFDQLAEDGTCARSITFTCNSAKKKALTDYLISEQSFKDCFGYADLNGDRLLDFLSVNDTWAILAQSICSQYEMALCNRVTATCYLSSYGMPAEYFNGFGFARTKQEIIKWMLDMIESKGMYSAVEYGPWYHTNPW